jgi:hypothetical protein
MINHSYYGFVFLLDAFTWTDLLQPQWYVENGGLWLLLFVVFAETGLFVGFFSPAILCCLLQVFMRMRLKQKPVN